MDGLNSLSVLDNDIQSLAQKVYTGKELDRVSAFYNEHCEIVEKELEILDIIKKHATNDGWSNGWVIKFWEMNETELKKVNKYLEKKNR